MQFRERFGWSDDDCGCYQASGGSKAGAGPGNAVDCHRSVSEESGESPSQSVSVSEAVGRKEEVARRYPLAERKGGDECCDGRDNVELSEGCDRRLDCAILRLPDGDQVAGLFDDVVVGQSCRCGSCILLEDVVPDADTKTALG